MARNPNMPHASLVASATVLLIPEASAFANARLSRVSMTCSWKSSDQPDS